MDAPSTDEGFATPALHRHRASISTPDGNVAAAGVNHSEQSQSEGPRQQHVFSDGHLAPHHHHHHEQQQQQHQQQQQQQQQHQQGSGVTLVVGSEAEAGPSGTRSISSEGKMAPHDHAASLLPLRRASGSQANLSSSPSGLCQGLPSESYHESQESQAKDGSATVRPHHSADNQNCAVQGVEPISPQPATNSCPLTYSTRDPSLRHFSPQPRPLSRWDRVDIDPPASTWRAHKEKERRRRQAAPGVFLSNRRKASANQVGHVKAGYPGPDVPCTDTAAASIHANAPRPLLGSSSKAVEEQYQRRSMEYGSRRFHRAQSLPNMRAVWNSTKASSAYRLMLPRYMTRHAADLQSAKTSLKDEVARVVETSSSSPAAVREAESELRLQNGSTMRLTVPARLPPINRHTLRELDLHEILKNPQLRHDLLFDANVQFRPNFDGERGRRKREAADRYWAAVSREVTHGCTCTHFVDGRMASCSCGAAHGSKNLNEPTSPLSRIAPLVRELRAVCLSVAPASDGQSYVSSIEAVLDTELLMQQVHHKVLDWRSLLLRLAGVLREQCGPTRHGAVDSILDRIDTAEAATALRSCFEVLEMMKLDMANQQLRVARSLLIDTASDFEARWFRDQIQQGRMSLGRTSRWLVHHWAEVSRTHCPAKTITAAVFNDAFVSGMMEMVFEPEVSAGFWSNASRPQNTSTRCSSPLSSSSLNYAYAASFPESFQFDAFRLSTFHNDAVDLTVVSLLLNFFRHLTCTASTTLGLKVPPNVTPSCVASKASALCQLALPQVKADIWCLVHEANAACLTAGPSAAIGGMSKLRDDRWRAAMKDVVLHVAVRAAQNWNMAVSAVSREPCADASQVAPLDIKVVHFLEDWLDKALSADSAVLQVCLRRVRAALAAMVSQGLSAPKSLKRRTRSDDDDGDDGECQAGASHKKLRLERANDAPSESREDSSVATEHACDEQSASCAIAAPIAVRQSRPTPTVTTDGGEINAIAKGHGLEALEPEMQVLTCRVLQVAGNNLKTFRNLYEKIIVAAQQHQARMLAEQV